MSKLELHDAFVIDGVRKTGDGYLTAFARVARTGIQKYKGYELGRPDLDVVRVYRPPGEVFAPDAMRSFAHRPVTLKHPPRPVTAQNWKQYSGGHTGDEVVRDGEYVRVPMTMMDSALVDAYERQGIRELSMGYSTDIQWTPGVTDAGEQYDAVQTAIRANHLALVPVARGGDQLRVGDRDFTAEERRQLAKEGKARPDGSYPIVNESDLESAVHLVGKDPGAKSWIIKRARALGKVSSLPAEWNVKDSSEDDYDDEGDDDETCPDCGAEMHDGKCPECGYTTDGEPTMKIMTLDGFTVSVADEQTASIIQRVVDGLTKRLKDADEEMDNLKKSKKKSDDDVQDALKQVQAKDGEIAVLKQKLKDAEVTPDKLDLMVKDRLVVIDAAKVVLGKNFAFDGRTIADIRKATVEARLGDAARGMSEGAIEGAFAAIVASDAGDSGTRPINDALASRRPGGMNRVSASDAAHAEMTKNLSEAWRTPAA